MNESTTKLMYNMILPPIFAAITCLLATVAIPLPFTPVPITLQVLGCAVSGAILGSKRGALAQLIYVLLGALGLPVFAGGTGGVAKLAGPTGGFLIGFIIAAFVIGFIVERLPYKKAVQKIVGLSVAMLVGLMVIYLGGTLWFMVQQKTAFIHTLGLTVIPYIPGDLVKIGLAVVVAFFVRQGLAKSGYQLRS